MKNKLTKYGVLIIAAVLLVAMAFAGVVSAESYTSDNWNNLGDSVPTYGTITITDGTATIAPKYQGSSQLTLTGDLTLDFSGYTTGFVGVPSDSNGYIGALLGNISLNNHKLEIIGLNMTSVNVASSGHSIGGILGYVDGLGTLNITNCQLINCSINGIFSSSHNVGGLVGYTGYAIVNIEGCKAMHCDVVSCSGAVGGLVGHTNFPSFVGCNVTNSTITTTRSDSGYVGGLVGLASSASFEACVVENASVYAPSYGVGGLVGYANTEVRKIGNCTVKNCVIASDRFYVGGLVGSVNYYSANNIGNCTVKNCTIKGSESVGGLVGAASTSGTKTNDVLYSVISGDVFGNWCGAIERSNTGSTGSATVKYYQPSGSELLTSNTNFWKLVSWGGKSDSDTKYTTLGQYGHAGGYGVGSYVPTYTASEWNALTDAQVTALSGTVYIVDPDENAVIYPKYNGSASYPEMFDIRNSLTLDFIGYKGKFAGEPSAGSYNKGALFGGIYNTSYTGTLTIKNLTMSSVNVTPTGSFSNMGGVIGYFMGKDNSKLNFTNCQLVNCSIGSLSVFSYFVGGLVGSANAVSVNVEDCKAMHCVIASGSYGVGGLVGYAASASSASSFVRCNVINCTVESTSSYNSYSVGGLVGTASPASFDSCGVENSSIYAGSNDVGGLVGYANSVSNIRNCTVKNCVVASGSYNVGGLVGRANSVSGITNYVVQNTAVNGTEYVGGLVGYAKNEPTDCSNNKVKNSAVKGTSNTTLDCGYLPSGNVGCTDTTGSHLNNGTAGQPLIIVYPHTGSSQPAPDQFGVINIMKLSNIGLLTAAKTAAAYVVYETTPVVFDPCNGSSTTYAGTVQLGATTIPAEKPVHAGYAFNGWNLTSSAGTMLTDKDGDLQVNVAGYTNDTSKWNNGSGATVNLFANWTVNETKVTPTENYVKFSNDNITALNSGQNKVAKVVLENVTQIEIGNEVNFTAENTSLHLPVLDGYTKINEICVFEIGAVKESGKTYSSILLNVTFENAQTASENKDNAIFLHYNTTKNDWDTTPLTCSLSQSGNNVQYLVHTTSFSPFGIGIYTKNSQPTPSPSYSSSSSKHSGYTQIMQEVQTITPTVAPTAAPSEPTTSSAPSTPSAPVAQPTQQSPAPFVGLLAGLGAAAVLLRMRK